MQLETQSWHVMTNSIFLRDLRYQVLKVCTTTSPFNREIEIYNHLKTIDSDHAGQSCLRPLVDSFEIDGTHGRHVCLVYPPLGISLGRLVKLLPDGVMNKSILKTTVRNLAALDFFHSEAHIIHTGS